MFWGDAVNLLLIDNNAHDRLIMTQALNQTGYIINIVEAKSSEEGLNFARVILFDVILLDYRIATLNNFEIMGALRGSTPEGAAIAMLSRSEDETLARQCIEAGAQDFLTKSEVTASRIIRAIMQAKERFRFEKKLLESHEKMRQLAEIDVLTGLVNRYKFEKALQEATLVAEENKGKLALLMLDLDKFKRINDTMGHDAGDRLLKNIADRLKESVREKDLLCRLGGDEFAILIEDLDQKIVQDIVKRIFKAMKKPINISGIELFISVSIGIATFPECAGNAIQLLKCADLAMYHSKEKGRNQAHVYSRDLHEKVQRLFQLEHDLHQAIVNGDFVLHYQPQFDTKTLSLVGAEALIRWVCPGKGVMSPKHFIPAAEEMGLIDQIGFWVIEEAIAQLSRWREAFHSVRLGFSIAINLSAIQLGNRYLLKMIPEMIETYNVPVQCVEFELTESALNDSPEATEMLQSIADMGIKLALDDFGTGYSSLFQLQKNPFQVLKIDRSFIQTVSENNRKRRFLNAVNAFAKTMGTEVVAEGVETLEQQRVCQKLSFDRLQGYYFSKPLLAKAFEEIWLLPHQGEFIFQVS